jgi:hypothetical protein
LLLETEDMPAYHAFHRRLVAAFSFSEDPATAAEAAMGMLLGPGETWLSIASQLADRAVTNGTNDAHLAYFHLVKALAEYRQGKFTSVEQLCRKGLTDQTVKPVTAVAAGAVRAMAQQQNNQLDEAKKTLAQAVELARAKLPKLESGDLGEDWPEWLIAHILSREARALIEGGTNAPNDPPKQK